MGLAILFSCVSAEAQNKIFKKKKKEAPAASDLRADSSGDDALQRDGQARSRPNRGQIGGRRISDFSGEIPEGSASAKGAATLARCSGSAGRRRLPHWLLLLRERRPASFCRPTAVCNQAISSLQQVRRSAVDAGRYF